MVRFIGWEGSYSEMREFQGRSYKQDIREYVIVSDKGLVHYKVCSTKTKVRIFTDLDASYKLPGGFPSDEMEFVKRHQQWGRMNRGVSRQGSHISFMPFGDTDELEAGRPELIIALKSDERANNAWETVVGVDKTPRFDDLLSAAEEITADQREVRLHERAVEMAATDETWGMF